MQKERQQLKAKRILLIEGHPSVRIPLERILTSSGHQVIAVESGERGLQSLVKGRFDTVVCSHQLPGISGLAFFSRSSGKLTKATTILTASFAGDYLANDALALGINVFMEMPFKIENLLACVEGRYTEICAGSLGQHLYVTSAGQIIAISSAQLGNRTVGEDPDEVSHVKTINLSGRQWKLYQNPDAPTSFSENDANPFQPGRRGRRERLKIIDS